LVINGLIIGVSGWLRYGFYGKRKTNMRTTIRVLNSLKVSVVIPKKQVFEGYNYNI
jgi:hypothetical protein